MCYYLEIAHKYSDASPVFASRVRLKSKSLHSASTEKCSAVRGMGLSAAPNSDDDDAEDEDDEDEE